MSQENVKTVRAGYVAFNRTHQPVPEMLHPDVEWHTADDLPDSGVHRGVAGIATLFSEWAGSFDDFQSDIEEIIDGGEEIVVVVVRLHGRLKGSNEEVELMESHVWRLLDGRAIEIREYRTKAKALEAAGLRE
jgi:ketosteroid isomerase-like protein